MSMFIDHLPKFSINGRTDHTEWTEVSRSKNVDLYDAFYKTSMCLYMEKCRKKNQCRFAHSTKERRPFFTPSDVKSIDFFWRTKMCREGDYCVMKDCGYAHSEQELRKMPCKYQSFCKTISRCDRSHYFLEPTMIVKPEDMVNSSLAYECLQGFKKMRDLLEHAETLMDKIHQESDGVLRTIDDCITDYNDQINTLRSLSAEYDKMQLEIQDDIHKIDHLLSEKDD